MQVLRNVETNLDPLKQWRMNMNVMGTPGDVLETLNDEAVLAFLLETSRENWLTLVLEYSAAWIWKTSGTFETRVVFCGFQMPMFEKTRQCLPVAERNLR